MNGRKPYDPPGQVTPAGWLFFGLLCVLIFIILIFALKLQASLVILGNIGQVYISGDNSNALELGHFIIIIFDVIYSIFISWVILSAMYSVVAKSGNKLGGGYSLSRADIGKFVAPAAFLTILMLSVSFVLDSNKTALTDQGVYEKMTPLDPVFHVGWNSIYRISLRCKMQSAHSRGELPPYVVDMTLTTVGGGKITLLGYAVSNPKSKRVDEGFKDLGIRLRDRSIIINYAEPSDTCNKLPAIIVFTEELAHSYPKDRTG